MQVRRLITAAAVSSTLALGGLALNAGAASAAPATATGVMTPAHYACSYTNSEPQLSVGSTGSAVKQAQCQLNSVLDRYVAADGIFGSDTKSATVAFQQCAGLPADGIIGPNTWRELDYWWNWDVDCHK